MQVLNVRLDGWLRRNSAQLMLQTKHEIPTVILRVLGVKPNSQELDSQKFSIFDTTSIDCIFR